MSDTHELLTGLRDYARCPECGSVLMSGEDDVFNCITEQSHGPFRLYYEVVDDD